MQKEVRFCYRYEHLYGLFTGNDMGLRPNCIDFDFYLQFPEFHEMTYASGDETSYTQGHGSGMLYPMEVWATVATALLSSTTVAKIIHSWLQSRKRRITIEIEETTKRIIYEGPNIKHDIVAIQGMINELAQEAERSEKSLYIEAIKLDGDKDEEVKSTLEGPKSE